MSLNSKYAEAVQLLAAAEERCSFWKKKAQGRTTKQTIHLLWVNQDAQPFVLPPHFERHDGKINVMERVREWAEDYNVIVWYDGKFVTSSDPKVCAATLRDVRKLPFVDAHPRLFSPAVSLYARIDHLKMLIGLHCIEHEAPSAFPFVLVDWSIPPMKPTDLLDANTYAQVATFGMVLMQPSAGGIAYENGLVMLHPAHGAMKLALRLVFQQHFAEIEGEYVSGEWHEGSSKDQYVYTMLRDAIRVSYVLAGQGTLKNEGGETFSAATSFPVTLWIGPHAVDVTFTPLVPFVKGQTYRRFHVPLKFGKFPTSRFARLKTAGL